LKKYLLINNIKRNNLLSFDLRKEIFLDKYKTNKKKEEYYTKCKINYNNNVRNKLFNKDMKYTSKTHKNILFYNNSLRYRTNINTRKINDENQSGNIFLNNNLNLNSNKYLGKTADNFFGNNYNEKRENSYINQKVNNLNSISLYTKRVYFQNRINKNTENNYYTFSGYNFDNSINCTSYAPYITKNGKISRPITKIIKNNHNDINNIFLSENIEDDYKIRTYNPKITSNLYSNYIINNNMKIKTERNIYPKIYQKNYLTSKNEIKKTDNTNIYEMNNSQFKEFMINYSNRTEASFDTLRKNLKKEFSNPTAKTNTFYQIKGNHNEKVKDINKKKLNNKYITYNNIININDPQIIHKDINLIKNYENKTPMIQTYLISFNSNKNHINNFFKDNLIYHRPKSSSKFRSKNNTLNYEYI
jgi:translation initiation factor 1 (eIF-1/SUI1)